ncbi:hypothetical protein M9H77_10850 [Catharanthus roseus]|uniref:Uncharacterized protein n=1 Tax=Catharanthus roseus TaxID=4058 RepID=A0ACC0BCW1_CATRO|nr:hypothetical protein M9H77_10850 [Catharanthus roseus]
MVRLGGRRGDDDLGPVTDRTSRVHGRTVTASSRAQESILEFSGQLRQIGVEFFYQMVGAAPHKFFMQHTLGLGEEHDRGRSPYIEGKADEGGDDGGDGSDDDQDEGEGAGDEEQPVPVAPVAYASGSDGRPRYRKGKGLIGGQGRQGSSGNTGHITPLMRQRTPRTLEIGHVLISSSIKVCNNNITKYVALLTVSIEDRVTPLYT